LNIRKLIGISVKLLLHQLYSIFPGLWQRRRRIVAGKQESEVSLISPDSLILGDKKDGYDESFSARRTRKLQGAQTGAIQTAVREVAHGDWVSELQNHVE
jgi:hypothetical protein